MSKGSFRFWGRSFTGAVALVLLAAAGPSWADDRASPDEEGTIPWRIRRDAIDSTGGVGMVLGKSNDKQIVTLQASSTSLSPMGEEYYKHSQARVEVGTGVGFALSGFGGKALIDPQPAGAASGLRPHLGFEPFNLQVDVNTRRDDYIEWLPMVSAGGAFSNETLELLVLGRGGGAVGTLGGGGVRVGYGAGFIARWKEPKLQLALDWTPISSDDYPIHLAAVDLSIGISPEVAVGFRLEQTLVQAPGTDYLKDTLGVFTVRFAQWKFLRAKHGKHREAPKSPGSSSDSEDSGKLGTPQEI